MENLFTPDEDSFETLFGIVSFPVVSLQDRIMNMFTTGLVEESVPVVQAFDEDANSFDYDSDVRFNRLDKYQHALDNEASSSYIKSLASKESSLSNSNSTQPESNNSAAGSSDAGSEPA